jgi:hypothetical protein
MHKPPGIVFCVVTKGKLETVVTQITTRDKSFVIASGRVVITTTLLAARAIYFNLFSVLVQQTIRNHHFSAVPIPAGL